MIFLKKGYVGIMLMNGEFIIGKVMRTFQCVYENGHYKLSSYYTKNYGNHITIKKCLMTADEEDVNNDSTIYIDINDVFKINKYNRRLIYSPDEFITTIQRQNLPPQLHTTVFVFLYDNQSILNAYKSIFNALYSDLIRPAFAFDLIDVSEISHYQLIMKPTDNSRCIKLYDPNKNKIVDGFLNVGDLIRVKRTLLNNTEVDYGNFFVRDITDEWLYLSYLKKSPTCFQIKINDINDSWILEKDAWFDIVSTSFPLV